MWRLTRSGRLPLGRPCWNLEFIRQGSFRTIYARRCLWIPPVLTFSVREGQSPASPPITAGVTEGHAPAQQQALLPQTSKFWSLFDLRVIIVSGFRCDGRRRAVSRISMDPISAAVSVAGVAAIGVQLSQTIYDLISTIYEAEKEMSSFANDVSLLLMVLNELEGVLRRGSRVYRQRMLRVVNEILKTCEDVFQSISKCISPNAQGAKSSTHFQRKVCRYFQSQRVRLLQAGFESMKSTLNVMLHVVHLARVVEAADSFS